MNTVSLFILQHSLDFPSSFAFSVTNRVTTVEVQNYVFVTQPYCFLMRCRRHKIATFADRGVYLGGKSSRVLSCPVPYPSDIAIMKLLCLAALISLASASGVGYGGGTASFDDLMQLVESEYRHLSLSVFIWRCEHAMFCVEILMYNVSLTHSCLYVYK